MKSFRQYHEEQINAVRMSKDSGAGDYLACMKANGAKVIGIYTLLGKIEKTKFPDTIFLGLSENNNLLIAITKLAGGIQWATSEMDSDPSDTHYFLDEVITKNKKIMLFLPVDINTKKGFTYKEIMWLADNCNNKKIMKNVTIVIGLYSIVSDKEMDLVSSGGRTSVNKLIALLQNWKGNISNKPPNPGFISKQPK